MIADLVFDASSGWRVERDGAVLIEPTWSISALAAQARRLGLTLRSVREA